MNTEGSDTKLDVHSFRHDSALNITEHTVTANSITENPWVQGLKKKQKKLNPIMKTRNRQKSNTEINKISKKQSKAKVY